MAREGFEELLALCEPRSGLRAFLGIHDSRRGPAFGGTRRRVYRDEAEALRDCLRLARAMSRKCALAGLEAGGGKVVMLDGPDVDVPAAYARLGERIEGLGGRFYTGPDVGTGAEELAAIAEHTGYVTHPGERGPGRLPDATAAGVVAGIGAALAHLDGREDWERRVIVVQGLGEVGSRVARALAERGARVLATEVDGARAGAVVADLRASGLRIDLLEAADEPARALEIECDVFSPCALGGILHDLTVPRLRCRIVAGAANNVLARDEHGRRLFERGILYVPDFVLSSGALIRGATFHRSGVRLPLEDIGARVGAATAEVLALAAAEGLPPDELAVREADRRIAAGRGEAPARDDAALSAPTGAPS